MDLYISGGSPFARVARIVALERGVPLTIIAEDVFPPQKAPGVNPAMQVPALADGDRSLFGTRLIVDYLMEAPAEQAAPADPPFAGSVIRDSDRWRDAQILVALEALLHSLVLRAYLVWTAAEHCEGARIPLDLREREEERARRLLDWLEREAAPDGFLPGVFSVQDVWLIAIMDWLESRLPFDWRGRPALEAISARHGERPSVASTRPAPWS